MKRLPCVLALAGALTGAPLALSACSTMSPIQTNASYNPGDGVPARSGPVVARNLLVVSEDEGAPGTLSGSVLNTSDAPVEVSFQTRDESSSNVAPATAIPLNGREQRRITGVTFTKLDAPPGALTDIYVVTPMGKTLVTVPVLAPQGYLETLRPTGAATTTAGPAATPTSTATRPGQGTATTTAPGQGTTTPPTG